LPEKLFLILFSVLTLLKVLDVRSVLNMGTGLMNAKENANIFIAHHAHLSSRRN
jgi:hypothetical protein